MIRNTNVNPNEVKYYLPQRLPFVSLANLYYKKVYSIIIFWISLVKNLWKCICSFVCKYLHNIFYLPVGPQSLHFFTVGPFRESVLTSAQTVRAGCGRQTSPCWVRVNPSRKMHRAGGQTAFWPMSLSPPDPHPFVFPPALALCHGFNLDTENAVIFQENARSFGQSVVQLEGSR